MYSIWPERVERRVVGVPGTPPECIPLWASGVCSMHTKDVRKGESWRRDGI